MSARLKGEYGKALLRLLPLALAVCGLPALAAYAATHRASGTAGAGKVSIAPRSERAYLPAPGAAPTALPLRLRNSGAAGRYVTGLKVGVAHDSSGCRSSANLRIVQSNVSRRHPIRIGGKRSVTLPAQGVSAPTIQLIDLPVSQDGCEGARFPLRFALRVRGSR